MAGKKQRKNTKRGNPSKREADYRHPEAETPLRPEVGAQAQFRKKKPPVTYRYDSSLSPTLEWDGQNPAREQGENAIREIIDLDTGAIDAAANADDAKKAARAVVAKAKSAAERLKRLGAPFLNWTGKAERLSFDVPTLPLFVHERLSTMAVIETLKSHEKRSAKADMFDLFGDPRRSISDQVLRAYEYKDKWVNRLILGDALLVMNSLLHYEGLGGQVQMIYIDPPYGVKFGSNFQPFVRKRDVSHNDDGDMTREPEMVKAYRDTWKLGLHSYLTYLRDRLLRARDLLHPSGSIFVQISDENVHHVRELMDEQLGSENFVSVIAIQKTTGATSELLASTCDFVIWYAKDRDRCKFRRLFTFKLNGINLNRYDQLELSDHAQRPLTPEEKNNPERVPSGARRFRLSDLTSTRPPGDFPVLFESKTYRPRTGFWKTGPEGFERLIGNRRVVATDGGTLAYVRYLDDWPCAPVGNLWDDISGSVQSRSDPKVYVVQTSTQLVQRCILMTTDPGDLVLDPTCGSGTTAYVAEQWGRRWITIDTSRVPLALARQRLLTATYPYYELKDEARGPASGFVYKRKQNKKGEEVGGVVPHITLKNIANNEVPKEEVLVDRPETTDTIVRVAGPFAVEATIPSPIDLYTDSKGEATDAAQEHICYLERMLEVLRKSPALELGGGKMVTLRNIRPPTKSLALSAEAAVDANGNGKKASSLRSAIDAAHEENTGGFRFSQRPVAIVFGPENGAISEKLVFEAAREAHAKNFTHLYVIGFAIQANARSLIETCEPTVGLPATYVQATPDLMMGELLKTTRASQIFSVCGMPEIKVTKLKPDKPGGAPRYQVELLGYDVFDPTTMEVDHKNGDDVPAWMLDIDYNGLVFHGSQMFFPRTSAWDALKKALKATHEESVWDHLAGSESAPFEGGEHHQIAVKVIDDRGNELLVVKNLMPS
jgi:adenine-specific DNA-methyltransferase